MPAAPGTGSCSARTRCSTSTPTRDSATSYGCSTAARSLGSTNTSGVCPTSGSPNSAWAWTTWASALPAAPTWRSGWNASTSLASPTAASSTPATGPGSASATLTASRWSSSRLPLRDQPDTEPVQVEAVWQRLRRVQPSARHLRCSGRKDVRQHRLTQEYRQARARTALRAVAEEVVGPVVAGATADPFAGRELVGVRDAGAVAVVEHVVDQHLRTFGKHCAAGELDVT